MPTETDHVTAFLNLPTGALKVSRLHKAIIGSVALESTIVLMLLCIFHSLLLDVRDEHLQVSIEIACAKAWRRPAAYTG